MPERQQISRKHRWKVQGRLVVLEYAAAHGLKPAAERFALDRKTVREWRDRAKAAGEVGLVPRYPKRRARRIPAETVRLIEAARREWSCPGLLEGELLRCALLAHALPRLVRAMVGPFW